MELDKIYNIDCLEGMKQIPDGSVDLIATDPPYELETHGGNKLFKGAKLASGYIDFISDGFDYDACFAEMLRVCKVPNIVIFCSNKQVSRIMSYFEQKGLSVTLLIWHKYNAVPLGNGKYISDVEFMVYIRDKGAYFNNDAPVVAKSKVYRMSSCNEDNIHPTQKPLDLIKRLIDMHSQEGQTVLDPFMGSGTTAVACIKEKRHFIGFELNKDYFDKACRRIDAVQRQLTLF